MSRCNKQRDARHRQRTSAATVTPEFYLNTQLNCCRESCSERPPPIGNLQGHTTTNSCGNCGLKRLPVAASSTASWLRPRPRLAMNNPLEGLAGLPDEQKRRLEDAIEQMQVRDRCSLVAALAR